MPGRKKYKHQQMPPPLAFRVWLFAALYSSLCFFLLLVPSPRHSTGVLNARLKVQATVNFSWVDCYERFQCTRLKVPLDYANNHTGNSVGIALIKYPANASADNYRGMFLFNPGGPGTSGVNALLNPSPTGLQRMARVLGPQYDIVSFDPRGVGVTTPPANFFLTEAEHALWLADPTKHANVANATHDETLLPKLWANAQLLGQMAKDRDSGGLLPYIGTENVARDMLRIIETAGQEKLLYWGASYGTVLGATFATMFPDRIDRSVIDGVADMEAWYSAPGDQRSDFVDTDKSLQVFFNSCVTAGPDKCAFHADSTSEIQANLESLYASVTASPIPVYNGSSIYGIVDYNALKTAVVQALYTPMSSYAMLSQGLAALQAGNGSMIYTMQGGSAPYECDEKDPLPNMWEVFSAVQCGDGAELGGSAADLVAYWNKNKDYSSFADVLTASRVACMGWKVYREGRFLGPISGNTSFPLLVIGNTADPITPLAAAKKTAAAFPGAVVLTQDSPGHTSFNVPSNCTDVHVRSYFLNGTLPEEGTICAADDDFFS